MKEWIKISDLLFFQEGPGVRNTQYTQSGVKLLNVANLVNGKVDLSTSDRYISEDEAYGRYKHFLCDDGDFIIASSGIKVEYFDRKMGFVDSSMLPLCMNTSTIRFKVIDSKRLNIKYFMYYLKSIHFKQQLSKFITGSAQLNFGPSHLKKMNMPLVSLKEQNDIVEKLSKVELLLDKYNGEIKLLDELIKARFVEMFGGINDSIVYPYKKLNEITIIISGGTPKRDKPEYWEDGIIPWVKTTELKNNKITYVEEHITQKGLSESSAKLVPQGTVLIAMYGQGKTRGMTAYLNVEASTNQACACILPSEKINSVFLWKYLEFSYVKLRSLAKGAGQPNLNVNMIKEFSVLVPPLNLQEEYASFVEEIDKSRSRIQKSLEASQELFDSLMQEYFG